MESRAQRSWVPLLLGAALVSATPGAALDFSAVDVQPLVEVHSALHFYFQLPILPPPSGPVEGMLMVTRGGALVSYTTTGCCGANNATFGRAVVDPAGLDAVRRALGEARIGIQQSCHVSSDLPEEFEYASWVTGRKELRWFGQRGRRNFLRVEYVARRRDSALPACPQELVAALEALDLLANGFQLGGELVSSILQGPDT